MNKKTLILSLAFGLGYLWVGGIFMSVFFRLYEHYDPTQVTYFSDVLYYIMQAAGVFLYALFIKMKPLVFRNRIINIVLSVITLLFGVIAMNTNDPIGMLVSGALMNISTGAVMCSFLIRISRNLPTDHRGKCFAFSYAIGSVGTYLISLPSGGDALNKGYIIWVYVALAAITVFLTILFDKECPLPAETRSRDSLDENKYRNLTLMILIPFFFMVINSFGYHFEQVKTEEINIVLTRAFYSIGLIAAGIIIDKKRHFGAFSAFIALSFPLICLSFRGNPELTFVSSILSYIFLGFINVYSVVLFLDIVDTHPDKAYMSFFGYGISRIGTAVGTTAGIMLESNQTLLICVTLVLYAICGIVFFSYQNIYYNRVKKVVTETTTEKQERIFKEYASRYNLNGKQTEVLRLLLDGCPNGEIADKLFLAESTVKYHVKNILKVTGFKNRNELIADYTSRIGRD